MALNEPVRYFSVTLNAFNEKGVVVACGYRIVNSDTPWLPRELAASFDSFARELTREADDISIPGTSDF